MLEYIAIAAIALFAFMLVSRIMKKRGKKGKAGREIETATESWARGEVAKIAAEKLELEELDVLATLSADPDADIVTRLEAAVAKVELVYERVAGKPAVGSTASVDVRVEVNFEDGRIARSVKRVAWSELPESVSAELEKTGTAHVFRPFLFPWQL